MLSLSCVLVTCPFHLLPQAAHIASTNHLWLLFGIGSALRVVVHASAVISRYRYRYLIGYLLGIMTHATWLYLLRKSWLLVNNC
jgi:hypothetical protein